ncbi:choline dehydrogenase [Altererythrobacter atlanticus]|uniref:Oxygen-dependent choline dehydrogenase n=1 Tax=Croceibacterium atlanticum TaxID=1267766 RepID=A0A0F7KWW0_9SPHN|nr:GMC family oxidoreductase N-terminal domain-containing protein [Croceibacterium atlanticum]AKH43681.1 Oxygen-dependent choline dehydrogenase [Croceibacterium atlanticum]MBB5733835.1 choline dehydrogenase [Croceibacterium atlanticum]
MTRSTDFIVVGAGSAGAVVAARLSENPDIRVTLIEAGNRELHPLLTMPIAFPMVMADKRFNWGYEGEPEPHADNRRLRQPRGKGLGGSSLINGMLYARGHPRDYDEWRQLGLEGWSYEDVLPFFKKSEEHWGPADQYHGKGGPLTITKHIPDDKLYPRFIEAVTKLGYKTQADHHGPDQEGWGSPDISIHKGRRGSTSERFLYPAMKRPNLTVITGALATRIAIEGGRARALHYRKDGAEHVLHADREIVLAGGAFNTPQLMLLSGIGPADELRELGVEVVHDLPGVGRNLQDHPSVGIISGADRDVTLTNDLRFDRLTLSVLQWIATGKGRIANMPVTANGWIKTREDLERPDAQCLFQPTSIFARPWFPGIKQPAADVVAMACVLLRPESRGWVKLASTDPAARPRIFSNILGSENDRAFFRRIVPQIREIFATSPLADIMGTEIAPGPQVQTRDEIDAWVRQATNTAMHPVGSCAMGTGEEAVCDAQLRVRGIDGLRIADASVMPRIVGGNTNAACIMIGEKAAAMMADA